MAVAYFNGTANTLNAASWSDATGFADNAELVIRPNVDNGRAQAITANLDRSGDTTGSGAGIHFLHVLPGFAANIGSDGSPLITEFDTSYTTQAQVKHSGAGDLYIQGDTCALVENHGTGSLYLKSGTWTTIVVRSGTVVITEDAIFDNLYVEGGNVTIEDHASSDYDLIVQTGGSIVCKRGGATSSEVDLGGTGRFVSDLDSGEHKTVRVNSRQAVLVQKRGNIATLRGFVGISDETQATEDATFGATAITTLPSFTRRVSGNAAGSVTYTAGGEIGGPPGFAPPEFTIPA